MSDQSEFETTGPRLAFFRPDRAPLAVSVSRVEIAGYTGRNRSSVEIYVAKLKEEGIPPPAAIPSVFSLGRDRAVQHGVIDVTGTETCGEVEFVLIDSEEGWHVTVGSDHTDRAIERSSIPLSKQVVAKPLAATAWPWPEVVDHWDQVVLESAVGIDRRPYQRAGVDFFLRPEDLAGLVDIESGTVVFGGTVSPILGHFDFDPVFHGRMIDPVLDRAIEFSYRAEVLPGFGASAREAIEGRRHVL